jgi:hypothetical protein
VLKADVKAAAGFLELLVQPGDQEALQGDARGNPDPCTGHDQENQDAGGEPGPQGPAG